MGSVPSKSGSKFKVPQSPRALVNYADLGLHPRGSDSVGPRWAGICCWSGGHPLGNTGPGTLGLSRAQSMEELLGRGSGSLNTLPRRLRRHLGKGPCSRRGLSWGAQKEDPFLGGARLSPTRVFVSRISLSSTSMLNVCSLLDCKCSEGKDSASSKLPWDLGHGGPDLDPGACPGPRLPALHLTGGGAKGMCPPTAHLIPPPPPPCRWTDALPQRPEPTSRVCVGLFPVPILSRVDCIVGGS